MLRRLPGGVRWHRHLIGPARHGALGGPGTGQIGPSASVAPRSTYHIRSRTLARGNMPGRVRRMGDLSSTLDYLAVVGDRVLDLRNCRAASVETDTVVKVVTDTVGGLLSWTSTRSLRMSVASFV
jgi:hypothetical protein